MEAVYEGFVTGAVELQKEVAQQTGLDLPPTFVFDYPSILEMCGFVLASMPPEVAAVPSQPVAVATGTFSRSRFLRSFESCQSKLLYLEITIETRFSA
jgi:hypothetical protein